MFYRVCELFGLPSICRKVVFFCNGKTRRIGLFGNRIKHKETVFVHFSTFMEGAHSSHCFICNNYSAFNNLLKIKRLDIEEICFCNY